MTGTAHDQRSNVLNGDRTAPAVDSAHPAIDGALNLPDAHFPVTEDLTT